MLLFFSGMAILILGYFTYGKFVRAVVAPDDRKTPAVRNCDGVDYLVLPHWKNMLIQLLNIAGIGPVIGVILGIKFGAIAFLIIPIGNIIGGAVHDFVGGMISLRHGGANLPKIVNMTFGRTYCFCFCLCLILILLLIVAVFINIPANLINGMLPENDVFWAIVAAIFLYYIAATLFPVDKIIGKIYPLFGGMLLIGTFAIFVAVLYYLATKDSGVLLESDAFVRGKTTDPIIPCLFVTIACGILSGFHATQSPIIARTMATEKQAYSSFYGMMVLEGLIAMIWAAAGMAIYNLFPELMKENPTLVLSKITDFFLGKQFGAITIIAVIILAITSGDTALRGLRLSLAELFRIPQKNIGSRFAITLPAILLVSGLLVWSNHDAKSFAILWNYFAWGNQILASSTLMAGSVWLFSQKKNGWITLIPGAFITFVVVTYIVWTSKAHGGPVGLGLPLFRSYVIAGIITAGIVGIVLWKKYRGVPIASEDEAASETASIEKAGAEERKA